MINPLTKKIPFPPKITTLLADTKRVSRLISSPKTQKILGYITVALYLFLILTCIVPLILAYYSSHAMGVNDIKLNIVVMLVMAIIITPSCYLSLFMIHLQKTKWLIYRSYYTESAKQSIMHSICSRIQRIFRMMTLLLMGLLVVTSIIVGHEATFTNFAFFIFLIVAVIIHVIACTVVGQRKHSDLS
jgi:hypothetical protein